MKLFHLVFGIYILMISSLSCTDVHDTGNDYKCVSKVSTSQSSNPNEEETCSPLCVCSCCGSLAVEFSGLTTLLQEEFTYHTFLVTNESSPKEISLSIWQPPQLG